ncbi:helix-turn-helix domain-containing protein [Inediibacterium massiliense]|uniref:helix-turn-helix domain-containing protein n=1 Tax=Inediibacterium massiliense TaxID=1658111 RepID=UPI0006B56B55|nr:helix-turn-helix domain-containing protein [Inediibacterium massiliense]
MNKSPMIKDLYESEVLIEEKMDDSIVFKMRNHNGEGTMTSYEVFPGIKLIYNDIHMEQCIHNKRMEEDTMEINHCREGRFECEFLNGTYIYLEEGDLAVNMLSNITKISHFPLAHYHGVSIVIHLQEASQFISPLLNELTIDLYELRDKLCFENRCFIMRAKDSIQHIFNELYSVPNELKFGYFKVKIMELFLFLMSFDLKDQCEKRRYFQKNQVDIIKEMKKYMTENMEKHFTLEELSEGFNISVTAMQQCFKGVYGTSIYAYMRSYRMKVAAKMLRHSHDSVTVIALKVGYENSSKFSAAFKAVMNITPLKYRKTYHLNGANLLNQSGKEKLK